MKLSILRAARALSYAALASFPVALAACADAGAGAAPATTPPEDAAVDLGPGDASSDVVEEATVDAMESSVASDASDASDAAGAACARSFGSALTKAFGRVDGTVVALVAPDLLACAGAVPQHLDVEIRFGGATYQLLVNVESDRGTDLRVSEEAWPHALPPPAWSEGWHPGLDLDYPTTLGAHAADPGFVAYALPDLVTRLRAQIAIGSRVSVYTSTGGPPLYAGTGHLVHRNDGAGAPPHTDGAIVLDPDGASPTFLLFRFATQSF